MRINNKIYRLIINCRNIHGNAESLSEIALQSSICNLVDEFEATLGADRLDNDPECVGLHHALLDVGTMIGILDERIVALRRLEMAAHAVAAAANSWSGGRRYGIVQDQRHMSILKR